jgi:hypothetical protein
MIHKVGPSPGDPCSSSSVIHYRDWESGLVLPSIEEQESNILCGLQDIGGHVMKIPLVAFQILLCMKLEVGFGIIAVFLVVILVLKLDFGIGALGFDDKCMTRVPVYHRSGS